MTSVQAIRQQLNSRSAYGKRLAAAETRIDKMYGHAPRAKKARRARTAPVSSFVNYPVQSFVGNPGYKRRPTPRVRGMVGNPAYRGTFVENMVDTVVEGTAMAIPGILTIKGTAYVADNWATKLKWFKGADGKANFWGRAATAVVVSAVAGAGARKFAGRYNLGKVNVGETAGNGIAMAAMLYALSGVKLPGLGKPLISVEGNVGSSVAADDDAPTIVIDAQAPSGQALLESPVAAYTSFRDTMDAQVGMYNERAISGPVTEGQPLM
jgi:hypothetical protein